MACTFLEIVLNVKLWNNMIEFYDTRNTLAALRTLFGRNEDFKKENRKDAILVIQVGDGDI